MTPNEQSIASRKLQANSMLDASNVDLSQTDATLPRQTREIFIGGAGTLKVTMVSGKTVTFTGVIAGSRLPLAVVKVFRTGTTATNIVALF